MPLTDAAIVRHLAEQVMGWTEQPVEQALCHCMTRTQFRLSANGALMGGSGFWWNPLSDARSADELLTALREKGYYICVELDGPQWKALVIHSKEGDGQHSADDSWLRALCLSAYRATGGPDAA